MKEHEFAQSLLVTPNERDTLTIKTAIQKVLVEMTMTAGVPEAWAADHAFDIAVNNAPEVKTPYTELYRMGSIKHGSADDTVRVLATQYYGG